MDVRRTIDAIARIESPKLIAALARMTRDVGAAEELAQDAIVAALETWPDAGVPDNPGAWLMTTAKRKAIDRMRRERRNAGPVDTLEREPEAPESVDAIDPETGRPREAMDLLSLMLVACHPKLPTEQRVALTLRLLGGLSTEEIARAFVMPAPTIAQRITRAKAALEGMPFEVPREPADLRERLSSVLEVVYLIFNEGYTSIRAELCDDALRLGRMLQGLAPDDAEVHGLAALMELQASRLAARMAPDGTPILLADQNRALWDPLLIQRGLSALAQAEALAHPPGPYTLQAAIAACHARAATVEATDWIKIAALYAGLQQQAPSPIVELNRAVAIAHAFGPAAGLALLDEAANVRALAGYHLLPAVRGDLLAKLGRTAEARREFERAAELAPDPKDKQLLLSRASACR